ncbi:hypothetical protein BLA60_05830 [Actinophytocola xinjiangensis]|uniref:Uncharacterized protein n=1 Tax=Actinophytocola xinjiangensis TaxID=485602 RepID=A0A7Z1B029_9PSEU|nr:hypothetical protein [Actinophytocola xinjiangensis]OLF12788.1 hypothetical protein BLA60_05830 [Actinophytocola xinjiangensis]
MTGENAGGRWRPTIDALVAGLAEHFGEPVTVVNANEIDDGFSCLVRGAAPTGPLRVSWEGVLGLAEVDGRPDVSVSVFVYSHGRRVRLDDQPGSYLELVHEGPLDGGTWREVGWLQDDFGEFAAHDRYGG